MKQKKSKTNLKALLNEDLASYYYTGFILADGHIDKNTRLQITLSVKDINYLTNMAKFLDIKNVKTNVYNNHEISKKDDYLLTMQYGLFNPRFPNEDANKIFILVVLSASSKLGLVPPAE